VLYVTGATLNLVVLTGLAIALGIVVYDAVIDVETVTRRLRQSRQDGRTESTPHIMLEAALEARRPIVYATVILLLAVAPLYWMGGVSGAFVRPLAVSYGLAVLASMVVAWTVTPALSVTLLANAPVEHRASAFVASRRTSAAPCWEIGPSTCIPPSSGWASIPKPITTGRWLRSRALSMATPG